MRYRQIGDEVFNSKGQLVGRYPIPNPKGGGSVKVRDAIGRTVYLDAREINGYTVPSYAADPVEPSVGADHNIVVTVDLVQPYSTQGSSRRDLSTFKRDLELVSAIKSRGRKLHIEKARTAALIAENLENLEELHENLYEHTLDSMAQVLWRERNGEGWTQARAELPPLATPRSDAAAAGWDALAENHYSKEKERANVR